MEKKPSDVLKLFVVSMKYYFMSWLRVLFLGEIIILEPFQSIFQSISNYHKLVSFDVTSIFTSVPVNHILEFFLHDLFIKECFPISVLSFMPFLHILMNRNVFSFDFINSFLVPGWVVVWVHFCRASILNISYIDFYLLFHFFTYTELASICWWCHTVVPIDFPISDFLL